MIEQVTSIQFKGQVKGTFNRPIISLCRGRNGLQTYFLKYPRNSNEIDGLLSEIICSKLAEKIHLNTPDIAFVEIGNHPIDGHKIVHHEKLDKGQIIFGSKNVEKADPLNRLHFVYDKHDFNRLEYPPHILRIGLFDMWVGNKDRKEGNYNLLLTQSKKQKLYIFDHFEAFDKITENNQNDIPLDVDVWQGFLSTSYGYEMLGWVQRADLEREADQFLEIIRSFDVNDFLTQILTVIPPSWNIKSKTIDYVERFLSSSDRKQQIYSEITNYLEFLTAKP